MYMGRAGVWGNGLVRDDLLQSRERNGWSTIVWGALTWEHYHCSFHAGRNVLKEQHLQRSEIPFYLWIGHPSEGLVAPLYVGHSCFLVFKMGPAQGCEI